MGPCRIKVHGLALVLLESNLRVNFLETMVKNGGLHTYQVWCTFVAAKLDNSLITVIHQASKSHFIFVL